MSYRFLFGKPVSPCKPTANGPRDLFILGAYPSALHVHWAPPGDNKPIKAVAVDNEPEPFWDGAKESDLVDKWKVDVGFRREWGAVGSCGKYNGPSGIKVVEQVLDPLGFTREQSWITDCLDTYHESKGAKDRLDDLKMRKMIQRLDIPNRNHQKHPSEGQIVNKAVEGHLDRLRMELEMASSSVVVTLGNAALRVFRELLDDTEGCPWKLTPDPSKYGKPCDVDFGGRALKWYPLSHPGVQGEYRKARARWVAQMNT